MILSPQLLEVCPLLSQCLVYIYTYHTALLFFDLLLWSPMLSLMSAYSSSYTGQFEGVTPVDIARGFKGLSNMRELSSTASTLMLGRKLE